MADEPRSLGDAPPGGADAVTLGRITELENEVSHLKKSVGFVADTNKFILIVLFAAFLVIIVAIGIAITTANKLSIKL